MPLTGCRNPTFWSSTRNRSRSPAASIECDARADDRHARFFEPLGQVKRRLPAELNDHAYNQPRPAAGPWNGRPLSRWQMFRMSSCVSGSKKKVAGVIIRRNRFGIRIDHHRLDPQGLHGEGRVNAAVIKLDPLTDAVGASADDDDLGFVAEAKTSSSVTSPSAA